MLPNQARNYAIANTNWQHFRHLTELPSKPQTLIAVMRLSLDQMKITIGQRSFRLDWSMWILMGSSNDSQVAREFQLNSLCKAKRTFGSLIVNGKDGGRKESPLLLSSPSCCYSSPVLYSSNNLRSLFNPTSIAHFQLKSSDPCTNASTSSPTQQMCFVVRMLKCLSFCNRLPPYDYLGCVLLSSSTP